MDFKQLSWTEVIIACAIALLLVIISQRMKKGGKVILVGLSMIYIWVLLSMTVLPITIPTGRTPIREIMVHQQPWNLKPLSLIIPQYYNMMAGQSGAARQFIGNILLLFPFGLLLPLLFQSMRKWYMVFIVGFFTTVLIETLQLGLRIMGMGARSFDVDDIILNTLGVILGYLIYKIFFSRAHKSA